MNLLIINKEQDALGEKKIVSRYKKISFWDIKDYDRVFVSDTLVILYLALMYIEFPVMLTDIRRWVREGWLPYLNTIQHMSSKALNHIMGKKKNMIYIQVIL
jgi:hypothetical protein